jgi:hypothetical protein
MDIEHEHVPSDPPPPAPKVDRRRGPRAGPFDPKKPPINGFTVKLSDEEWAAIHGPDPLSVYALRHRVRREWQIVPNIEQAHCPVCATRVFFKGTAAARVCLGCGQTQEGEVTNG